MNDLVSAAIVAVLLGVALFGGCWQIRRAQQAESDRNRIVRETRAQVVPDTERGVCLADQDACELLWSMPAFQPDRTTTTTEGDA